MSSSNCEMIVFPIKFEEYCNFYGIRHYGDKKTYYDINLLWMLVHDKMNAKQLQFSNYELLINYLQTEFENAQTEYKFIYWYVINQFNKYQSNADIYFQNFKEYNKRIIGYSKSRNCNNMKQLKQILESNIKRLKTNVNNDDEENKRQFIIMARYICDYLEESPDDVPLELFNA
jgi:hypothetical protein